MDRNLFIIGNGFDLWHGLQTKYSDFARFLKTNSSDAFDACNKFLGYSSKQNAIWGDFEESLGSFSPERLIEECNNYFNDDNPHRSGEASWEAKKYVDLIAKNTFQAFQVFITSLQYPSDIRGVELSIIQKDALYLNFNYTDTLERFYKIPTMQICHIHGTNEDIQIGHGVHPSDVESSNLHSVKPVNMSPEQEEHWIEQMNDEYSLSFDLACIEVDQYWTQLFKDVESNIRSNQDFFDRCTDMRSITVMGHSLSAVDIPYFKEIKHRVSVGALWNVSYRRDGDDRKMKNTLLSLGIAEEKISFFKLTDYVLKP